MAIVLANAIDMFINTTKVSEIKNIEIAVEIQPAQGTSLTTEWVTNIGGVNAQKEWTATIELNYDIGDAGQGLLTPDADITDPIHFTLDQELAVGGQELLATDGATTGTWSHSAAEGGNMQLRNITIRGKGPLVEQTIT